MSGSIGCLGEEYTGQFISSMICFAHVFYYLPLQIFLQAH